MRSTLEIFTAIKEKQAVTSEEITSALLVLELTEFTSMRMVRHLTEVILGGVGERHKASIQATRWLHDRIPLLKEDAAKCLGPENTPGCAEFDEKYEKAKNTMADLAAVKTEVDLKSASRPG